jgi:hypothetical protein
VRLAIRIALHLRVDSGKCNPSFKKLAEETSIGERSTYRLIDLLEHTGWLAVTRLSGVVNQYTLLTTATQMAGVDYCHPDGRSTTAKSTTPPLPNRGGTTANKVADKKRRTAKKTTKGRESDSPAVVAARGSKRSPAKKTPAARTEPQTQIDDSFREFWAIYPRRVARAVAERAFAAAVEDGADVAAVIEGAKCYAASRVGEPERYTAHASTWLRGKRWLDELPQAAGAVLDNATGEFVEMAKPQQRRREPPSMQELVAERQQLAAEGGAPW